MLSSMIVSSDSLVKEVFITAVDLIMNVVRIYSGDSRNVVGIEAGVADLTIVTYPFSDDKFIPSAELESIIRTEIPVGPRALFDIVKKKKVTPDQFSEWISLKHANCMEYPIFTFSEGPSNIVGYIRSPTPQELITLNLIINSQRFMRGDGKQTVDGRALGAILSSFELGLDFKFTSPYGMWNSPSYIPGLFSYNITDLNPLREWVSELKLDRASPVVFESKAEISEGSLYLGDILTMKEGFASLVAQAACDIEVFIDISPEIFEKMYITSGGVLIKLQKGCNKTLQDIIEIFDYDNIVLITDPEEKSLEEMED